MNTNYETILETAKKRRSVRLFETTSVSREDIEKIIDVGALAPSGANFQPWEIVVVDDPQTKTEVGEIIVDSLGKRKTSLGFFNAPVFLLV